MPLSSADRANCVARISSLGELAAGLRSYVARFGLGPNMSASGYEQVLAEMLRKTAPPAIGLRAKQRNWAPRVAAAMTALRDGGEQLLAESTRTIKFCWGEQLESAASAAKRQRIL